MVDDEDTEGSTDFHRRVPPSGLARSFVLTFLDEASIAPVALPPSYRGLLGQSPICEIRLVDSLVSRRHASLEVEGQRLHLVDLRSTNGTRVNGVSVVDAYLEGGEIVTVGVTRFRVSAESGGDVVKSVSSAASFGRVMGISPEMRRLYPLCERLAATDVPLVIEGETGTGKEALAEAIHLAGPRARAPFVVFDCTAVPGNLMESELFGHEKGAFTGAGAMRRGVFEQAEGGTLLIDEIGDLEASLQPKLLRAVERREIRRLGGDRTTQANVRVICATRRDLDREVQAGRFRDDLFHRIAVTRIELPPLRRRSGDVRALTQHFFGEFGLTPPPDLVLRWEDQAWPGNVRELRNAVARWVAVGDLGKYKESSSDEDGAATSSDDVVERLLALNLPLTQARQRLVESFERRYIERMLERNQGHVGRAAAASGIGRRYFQMLLARRT